MTITPPTMVHYEDYRKAKAEIASLRVELAARDRAMEGELLLRLDVLEDNERLRAELAASEAECDRLRADYDEIRAFNATAGINKLLEVLAGPSSRATEEVQPTPAPVPTPVPKHGPFHHVTQNEKDLCPYCSDT